MNNMIHLVCVGMSSDLGLIERFVLEKMSSRCRAKSGATALWRHCLRRSLRGELRRSAVLLCPAQSVQE